MFMSQKEKSIVFIGTINSTFSPIGSGALSTGMYHTAKAAIKDGYKATVIARKSFYATYNDVPSHTIPYPVAKNKIHSYILRSQRKFLGWEESGHLTWARNISRIISKQKLELSTFFVSNDPYLACYLARKHKQGKVIARFHNDLKLKKHIIQNASKYLSGFAAVSQHTARHTENLLNLKTSTCRVVYNGVDHSSFNILNKNKGKSKIIITFVGQMIKQKGPDILIKSCIKLQENGIKNFKLQLIGSNRWGKRHIDEFQTYIDNLILQAKHKGVEIEMLGYIARYNIPNYLKESDIHVTPSRWDEPFGLTTVEGMACGVPVIASDTGGTPEIVNNHGLLFKNEDVNGLASLLASLIQDPELRRHYADLCHKRSLDFTWEKTWYGLKTFI